MSGPKSSLAHPPSEGSYDRVASLYDRLGDLYTQGGIRRSKRAHLPHLREGEKVAYLGAGTGEECVLAAQKGAIVTVVDSSQAMLDSCRRRFEKAGVPGIFLQQDALLLREDIAWDIVVAPYFLNVFSEGSVVSALGTLARKSRPGGRFISVDFRAPSKSRPFRLLQNAYYLPPLTLFASLTQNPWHRLYDYDRMVQTHALPLNLKERIITRAFGLPLLETLIWEVT